MKKSLIALILLALSLPAMAEVQHEHSSQSTQMASMEGMKHQATTQQCARVDDFDLCFDIMPHRDYQKMMEDMKMEPMKPEPETTHHVAVTVRKDGIRVGDAAANMKIISPDGGEEARMLKYNPDMMQQYVGHFNMQEKGKYQVIILFKVGEDTHQGGVYYEIK